MRILIVEDDKILGDGLVSALTMEQYAADWVKNVAEAKDALAANEYALMILDLGLPDGSGLEVLKGLREKQTKQGSQPLPVLILTAYDTFDDRIKGLDHGADDYLIKPFDLGELMARVRALRRRAQGQASPLITLGPIALDPAARRVTLNGAKIELGPKELALLHLLMEKSGKIVTKAQLEDSLYGWDMEIESNTVEVHIHGLRKKLGKEAIRTVRGLGYVMDAPDKETSLLEGGRQEGGGAANAGTSGATPTQPSTLKGESLRTAGASDA